MAQRDRLTNGPAAAAILAAGIGCFALGVLTSLAEAIPAVSSAINFYQPVGPLSGKTILAVAVWVVAWAVTYGMWRTREVDFEKTYAVTIVLIALGLLATFPLFFELFAA